MDIGEAIYGRLNGYAGLTALSSARIYPIVAPQGAKLPFVTFQQISGPRVHAMSHDPGLTYPRYQVSAWSTKYSNCLAMAKQIRLALQDWTSTTTLNIQRVFHDGEVDLSDNDPQTKDVIYHRANDFIVWYST